ncbi:transmembrane protein 119-like [Denticeps clupeoides]|uniref:Transmembrane protein 119 n=1 Tax=Denticeps clupeoides TaxID=299321 RepID=A0AAY4CIT2_9TELE|nr:transmembrane protein 119-like [Denticeps clupeoides]
MTPSLGLHLASAAVVLICWSSSFLAAFPFNVTEELSGDGAEPEFIFPIMRTTRMPASIAPTQKVTTITRLKDFVFNQVVDFLKDNLLLITVVTSLLIVIIFIVCCASAMSHKRKLDAFYPPAKSFTPRTYMDHGARPRDPKPQQQPVAQHLRAPSKALVGDKEGKDPRPKPQAASDMEKVEAEVQKEEPQSSSPSKPLVCTCHLKKATPPAH